MSDRSEEADRLDGRDLRAIEQFGAVLHEVGLLSPGQARQVIEQTKDDLQGDDPERYTDDDRSGGNR